MSSSADGRLDQCDLNSTGSDGRSMGSMKKKSTSDVWRSQRLYTAATAVFIVGIAIGYGVAIKSVVANSPVSLIELREQIQVKLCIREIQYASQVPVRSCSITSSWQEELRAHANDVLAPQGRAATCFEQASLGEFGFELRWKD